MYLSLQRVREYEHVVHTNRQHQEGYDLHDDEGGPEPQGADLVSVDKCGLGAVIKNGSLICDGPRLGRNSTLKGLGPHFYSIPGSVPTLSIPQAPLHPCFQPSHTCSHQSPPTLPPTSPLPHMYTPPTHAPTSPSAPATEATTITTPPRPRPARLQGQTHMCEQDHVDTKAPA